MCPLGWFLRYCEKSGLKSIRKSGAIEPSPRIDKDTKDVPSIPDVANTILEKIQGSDCFLCDISFIGTTGAAAGVRQEPLPNPNVMMELGYALSELGWERIILIINTATGSAEDLPFDLRNRRWPIPYELTAEAEDIARTEAKRKLTMQIQDAVEAIAKLPPRRKPGTTQQRLDALEQIVGKLSGSVAQNTTMANLVAGLQRLNQEPPAGRPDAETKCLSLRTSLIKRVLAGEFEKVAVRHGMLVVAICPSSVPARLPLFDSRYESLLQLELRPLYASGWDHRLHGERFVNFSKWDQKIEAATEITLDGTICAAGHEVISVGERYLEANVPADVLIIPSVAFEKSIIEAVFHYLRALSVLGTKGPWSVGLGITNLTMSMLHVGVRFAFGGHAFEGNEILPPLAEIGPNIELENPQAIARELRPIFDYIWREHGYPESLNYAQTGDWIGR